MRQQHWLLLPVLATGIAALETSENRPSAAGTLHRIPEGAKEGEEEEELNRRLARLSILVGGLCLAFVLVWNAALRFQAHIRRLTNLSNGTQRYWFPADPYWAWLKKSVIYAPLLRTRHNREFRLSSVVNMGTLPTRFQTFLVLGLIAMNTTLCFITIPYWEDEHEVLGQVRNRAGTMAVVNLMALVVIAGRNNPLIKALDVSFDTWNLLHRWFGRIVVMEVIIHVVAWMIRKVRSGKFFPSHDLIA